MCKSEVNKPEQATHLFRGSKVVLRASWPADDYTVALVASPNSSTEFTVPLHHLHALPLEAAR